MYFHVLSRRNHVYKFVWMSCGNVVVFCLGISFTLELNEASFFFALDVPVCASLSFTCMFGLPCREDRRRFQLGLVVILSSRWVMAESCLFAVCMDSKLPVTRLFAISYLVRTPKGYRPSICTRCMDINLFPLPSYFGTPEVFCPSIKSLQVAWTADSTAPVAFGQHFALIPWLR